MSRAAARIGMTRITHHDLRHFFATVASESGGLFQTGDGGNSWKHLDGLPPFRMADVKYSPVSSQWLLATAFADKSKGGTGRHEPMRMTSA
jgi:photosystem II stability/assembly factor-like uncharacterized protein